MKRSLSKNQQINKELLSASVEVFKTFATLQEDSRKAGIWARFKLAIDNAEGRND